MNVEKVRSVLIKILLGTLIATAVVAVGIILFGSVGDLLWRVVGTMAAGVFYLGVLLAVLSTIPHIGTGTKSRSSLFVVNSLLALTCASYLTLILSIWTVINGDLPWRIHAAYFVMLAGILYAKPLMDLEAVYGKIKPYIYANYAFIALACVLTSAAIIAPREWHLWDGFLGRAVAASVVINVTLSMVITVLYHLYLQAHPELRAKQPVQTIDEQPVLADTQEVTGRPTNPWVVIIIILGIMFVGLPILGGAFSAIMRSAFGGY